MLKNYGVGCGGGLQDFSISPSPLGFNWGGNWELGWTGMGLCQGVWGLKGLAQGLDNFRHSSFSSDVPSFSSYGIFACKIQKKDLSH